MKQWMTRLMAATLMLAFNSVAPAIAADSGSAPAGAAEQATAGAPEAVEPVAWLKPAPATIDDLRAIQKKMQERLAAAKAVTVVVEAGGGSGSGVIVSEDGYVMTAAHVSGAPGRDLRVILADGKVVKAKSLGASPMADAGLAKIADGGKYEFAPIGHSGQQAGGAWCFALGHPGGYDQERGPVVRLGRVIAVNDYMVWSDCKLLGGDSGGPLFDLDGKVIGIHSRISMGAESNYHAPADAFTRDWDRLAAGEQIDPRGRANRFARADRPQLGVRMSEAPEGGAKVEDVLEGTAAAKAGLQVGDLIVGFEGQPVTDQNHMLELINARKIGDAVKIEVVRAGNRVSVEAKLARWRQAR